MTNSRRPRRFFSQESLAGGNKIISLSPEESQHLRQILRLGIGDKCLVLDSAGAEGEAVVKGFKPDGCAELQVSFVLPPAMFAESSFHLCVAIPKGVKFEFLIQKAQEIGAASLTPLMTERTIVRIDPKKESPKQARWLKIAQEAAKQSGCRRILDIPPAETLAQALKDLKLPKGILAVMHPSSESIPIRQWMSLLEEAEFSSAPVKVFIGPEGGFSKKEIELMKISAAEQGWVYHQVSLGGTILKVDTAVIAAASILKFWKEPR